MCSMNIFVGLCVAEYLQIGMPINFCRAKMSTPLGQHDQAEPRGLQYIELPALQVGRGEILIPN